MDECVLAGFILKAEGIKLEDNSGKKQMMRKILGLCSMLRLKLEMNKQFLALLIWSMNSTKRLIQQWSNVPH
jgi:hypothetical protein